MTARERTNYFELLGLPRRLTQAAGSVDRAFRETAKRVHPDRLGPGASAVDRRSAVEQTAQVNEAYRTLRTEQTRAEYLLSLEGLTVGDEMARTKDPEFLMEMMQAQEAVDDAESLESLESQRASVDGRRRGLIDDLRRYFDDAQGEQDAAARALDELRYLKRLLDRIDAKLEEMM